MHAFEAHFHSDRHQFNQKSRRAASHIELKVAEISVGSSYLLLCSIHVVVKIWYQFCNKLYSKVRRRTWALFIYPTKSYFFIRLQIFLHAGCNFLPSEELPPHAKMMSLVIDIYKFGQEIFTIGIFWIFLYEYIKTV